MMASLGKATLAVVSGTQETTLALANLNFDFSLFKVEPPTEYKAIGERLSERRRAAAETGMEHVIARRLGALFSRQIPSTPNLIKAYGTRSSEIIKATTDHPSGPSHGGVFQEWTGPDATSIWAAATSGSGAISIHMLACMLARIWPASEAESIWDEIIQARKKELETSDPADPLNSLSELARIEVTREHLSSWDSSARAWLEVADGAKMREQKQLLLLTQNIGIPISPSEGVYASVMEAWRTALVAMENMVSGMPQSIQDGSVILALTSWHLYPDMYVLEAGPNRIAQNDPLVPPSGVVTLGISSQKSKADAGGVYWSLPLAFLKYYGDPVPSTTVLEEASTRLCLSEFLSVVLGSILSTWGPCRHDLDVAVKIIFEIGEVLTDSAAGSAMGEFSRTWPCLLAHTAEKFLTSSGLEKQHLESLITRGLRRCKSFLASPEDHPPSVFGLSDITTLLGLISEVDHRVSLLRAMALGIQGGRPDTLLIRYRRDGSRFMNMDLSEAGEVLGVSRSEFLRIPQTWEYATALPKAAKSKKRKRNNQKDDTHSRWVENEYQATPQETFCHLEDLEALDEMLDAKVPSFSINGAIFGQKSRVRYEFILGDPEKAAIFKSVSSEASGSALVDGNIILEALCQRWIDDSLLRLCLESLGGFHSGKGQYLTSLRSLAAAAEVYKLMPNATITTGVFCTSLKDALWVSDCKQQMLAEASASLSRAKETGHITDRSDVELSGDEGQQKAGETTGESFFDDAPDASRSQDFMEKGSLIPGTALDPRVAFGGASTTAMASDPDPLGLHIISPNRIDEWEGSDTSDENIQIKRKDILRYRLSRPQSFACIAMLENQNVNLNPSALKQVMALSSGNSIYVATPLICDPIDAPEEHEVKRIVGNIGKPGISLMIPPMRPKVRKLDETKWSHISHVLFDGKLDDAFQHTSLHLSFTRYKLPVMASHGYQAVVANFVETPVSIFDREGWIADVDILKAMNAGNLKRMSLLPCNHGRPQKTKPAFPLTSIDSWDELLDLPPNPRVFRARNNWLARLAGTALSQQIGISTVVLPDCESICWKCVECMVKEPLSYCDDKSKLESPLFIA